MQTDGEAPIANKGKSTQGFLSTVLGAGTLVSVFVFVIGWIYLDTYYRLFGVNINSLKFESTQYLMFSFTQFEATLKSRVFLGLLFLFAILVLWAAASARRAASIAFLLIAYLVLLWIGARMAYGNAHAAAIGDMTDGSSLPKIVAIDIKNGAASKFAMVDRMMSSGNLRILIEDDNRLLLFRPLPPEATRDSAATPSIHVDVLEVHREDILFVIRSTTLSREETK